MYALLQHIGPRRERIERACSCRLNKSGARMIAYSLLAPVLEPFGPDLAYLALVVAQNLLDPQIEYEGSWHNVGEAMAALRNRQVQGKAVLHVD